MDEQEIRSCPGMGGGTDERPFDTERTLTMPRGSHHASWRTIVSRRCRWLLALTRRPLDPAELPCSLHCARRRPDRGRRQCRSSANRISPLCNLFGPTSERIGRCSGRHTVCSIRLQNRAQLRPGVSGRPSAAKISGNARYRNHFGLQCRLHFRQLRRHFVDCGRFFEVDWDAGRQIRLGAPVHSKSVCVCRFRL